MLISAFVLSLPDRAQARERRVIRQHNRNEIPRHLMNIAPGSIAPRAARGCCGQKKAEKRLLDACRDRAQLSSLRAGVLEPVALGTGFAAP